MPFDLFFFQFVLPQYFRYLNLKPKFISVVRKWFEKVAHLLRMTQFLLGDERPDEESDFEDNQTDIRYLTVNNVDVDEHLRIHVPKRDQVVEVVEQDNNTDLDDDNAWEDVDVDVQTESATASLLHPAQPKRKQSGREKRYLRVPNHDSIEIVPGLPVLVWVKEEDPVFGLDHETPEQIERNWTRVYAPNFFKARIYAFLILKLISFALAFASLLIIPTILGRFVFYTINKKMSCSIEVPSDYVNPIQRELPTHDLYAYFAGFGILALTGSIVFGIYEKYVKPSLQRRNSIRRSRNERNPEPQATILEQWTTFWQRHGRLTALKYFKLAYLVLVVGILCPLLLGLVMDFYFLTPVHLSSNRVPIIFPIVDWSTGIMFLRIIYNLMMLIPNRPIPQLIINAQTQGLALMDIIPLTRQLFAPIIFSCVALLALPVATRVVENQLGMYFLISGLGELFLEDFVLLYGAILFVGVFAIFKTLSSWMRSIRQWLDRLKDDLYLVGQTLQNVDET
jgi:E3 ubiquitin-protein ligase MARCH6